jgi:hypothetical protein
MTICGLSENLGIQNIVVLTFYTIAHDYLEDQPGFLGHLLLGPVRGLPYWIIGIGEFFALVHFPSNVGKETGHQDRKEDQEGKNRYPPAIPR